MQSALERASAFHFEWRMDLTVTGDRPSPGVSLQLQGDYQAPDRLRSSVSTNAAGMSIQMESIAIGTKTWAKNFMTGEWSVVDGGMQPDPFKFGSIPLQIGNPFDIDLAELDMSLIGTESVDGVDVWQYTGERSPNSLPGDFRYDVYVGAADALPRRIALEWEVTLAEVAAQANAFFAGQGMMPPTPTNGVAKWRVEMKYSRYGEPIEIVPPPGF
ncbi:MAG: hypothetical protein Q7R41_01670 [Phycisphaerales bacterium]|nr:hypothetical protein [Phycisphaerales bacterium]